MRDLFPVKSPGDSLDASHVNNLSDIALRTGTPFPSTGMHHVRGGAVGLPPFQTRVVEVFAVSTGEDGIYDVHPMFYDGNVWVVDAEIDYELDVNMFSLVLEVGDRVSAWWSSQRGAFIPSSPPTASALHKEGVLFTDLVPADGALDGETTAILFIYTKQPGDDDPSFSGSQLTVTNRFTEIETIVAGTWMVVVRINKEWRPVAADCGATALAEGSSSSSTSSQSSPSSSSPSSVNSSSSSVSSVNSSSSSSSASVSESSSSLSSSSPAFSEG